MGESSRSGSMVRVLVIEDLPDDRELLLYHLQKSRMDSHVKFFSDGKEARDFLNSSDFSHVAKDIIAIFLDLKLPKIGGLEILRLIRRHEVIRDVPVVVMTASNNPVDLEECRGLKVANYISKPVTFTSFSKAVADVFHRPLRDTGLAATQPE